MRPAASVGEIFAVDSFNPDMRVNLLIGTDRFRDLIFSKIKTNLGFSFFGQNNGLNLDDYTIK